MTQLDDDRAGRALRQWMHAAAPDPAEDIDLAGLMHPASRERAGRQRVARPVRMVAVIAAAAVVPLVAVAVWFGGLGWSRSDGPSGVAVSGSPSPVPSLGNILRVHLMVTPWLTSPLPPADWEPCPKRLDTSSAPVLPVADRAPLRSALVPDAAIGMVLCRYAGPGPKEHGDPTPPGIASRSGHLLTAAWANQQWTQTLAALLNAPGTVPGTDHPSAAGGDCAREDTLVIRFVYERAPSLEVLVHLRDDCAWVSNGVSQASMPSSVIHWLRMSMPSVWVIHPVAMRRD